MKIDRNSYFEVILSWLLMAGIAFLSFKFLKVKVVAIVITALLLALVVFITAFFRIPKRKPSGDGRTVTAVADGKIVILEKTFEKEYLKKDCMQVSIYMDFFDVHANFWPVSGVITYYKYHPGKYLLAFRPKSSELNEHTTTAILSDSGKEIVFKQIAGTFARRIVSYSKVGDRVAAGDQCGIIKFGSRIDIFLPLDTDMKVSIGECTRAVETVIAAL